MPVQPYIPAWADEPPVQQNSKQILVADDDPALVNLLREDLEMEGHKISCAYDGQMALRLARAIPFDLIILDVNMPMTNGLKVLEFLRANADTARVPVIFVTGELSQDVFPVLEQAPRVAHVKKPLDLESFNSLIKHFLERYPNP